MSRGAQFPYVLIGVLLLQALRLVPALGFIVALFVGTPALGAALAYGLERRWAKALPAAPWPSGEAMKRRSIVGGLLILTGVGFPAHQLIGRARRRRGRFLTRHATPARVGA